MAEQLEFEFPDQTGDDGPEKVKKKAEEEKIAIEVVDDTPIADRGREPMPKEIAEEIEKDDLSEYSERVRQRMAALKKVYHDERRAKEAASREREEALKLAQTQHEELRSLRERLTNGEKIFITEVTAAAKQGLEVARSKLKAAYESGDSGQIAEAQELLTDAKLKARDIDNFKPTAPLQTEKKSVEDGSQAQAPRPATPPPDPKAEAWRSKNGWFGVDSEMTAAALGLHEKLVKSGVDPRTDEYYKKVDETMRKRFPENFEEEKPAPVRPNVVAPATRSTAPRRITLTASQAALANRLGITKEAYVKEYLKLENANG